IEPVAVGKSKIGDDQSERLPRDEPKPFPAGAGRDDPVALAAQQPLVAGHQVSLVVDHQDRRHRRYAVFTNARSRSVSVMMPTSWPLSTTGRAPILGSSRGTAACRGGPPGR